MSIRSYRWEQVLVSVFSRSHHSHNLQQKLASQQLSSVLNKGLLLLVLVSFWCWNWQILISAIAGLGLMWSVYLGYSPRWQKSWRSLSRLLVGFNRRLVFALASGVSGGLFTYLAINLWAETENSWLAFSSILQSLLSLLTLSLLGCYLKKESSQRQSDQFANLLTALTAQEPLKCLIAVNQLTEMVKQGKLSNQKKSQLKTYFQFMLTQSPEPTLQDSLLDSLNILDFEKFSLISGSAPEQIRLEHPIKKRFWLEVD